VLTDPIIYVPWISDIASDVCTASKKATVLQPSLYRGNDKEPDNCPALLFPNRNNIASGKLFPIGCSTFTGQSVSMIL
jgi:hypothetical protein